MAKDLVKAYVGLGSNLGDRKAILESAVADLDNLPATKVTGRSSWLENPAIGIEDGCDFLNGAVEIETGLSAHDLLDHLRSIEERHGRDSSKEGEGYHNRTLDLDLLLYGDDQINEPGLIVPHPRMMERDFVLIPLRELGKTLASE